MANSPVLNLFQNKDFVNVSAPMVRYSKLPFRQLLRTFGCDLCFTPMIIGDSFIRSEKARKSEFTTNSNDTPLIVQFAARNSNELLTATEFVASYSDGVDLNCGCPQKWAMSDGYGAKLLSDPQNIKEMVLDVRNKIRDNYTVSVKIRLLDEIKDTISFCQSLEAAGVSFITVHGRKIKQRSSEPVDRKSIKEIVDSLRIPLIANGDIVSLETAKTLHQETGCQGIMAARGLLTNPALFAGYQQTPIECIQRWVSIIQSSEIQFKYLHHHLVFMLEKVLPKKERLIFNVMKTKEEVLTFLNEFYDISYDKESSEIASEVQYIEEINNDGKYFEEKVKEDFDEYLEGSLNFF